MKKIKRLLVIVTYETDLNNLEVTGEVYNGLKKIEATYGIMENKVMLYNEEHDEEKIAAFKWLKKNTINRYGYSFEYEVEITE